MENSSKALLIAAVVLIVILLIALGMKIFNSTNSVGRDATDVGKSILSATEDAVTELKSSFDKTGVGGTSVDKETPTIQEETPTIQEGTPTYIENKWVDNGDGTFSKGITKVKIGDYVNYTYDTASAYFLNKTYSGYTSDQTISQKTGLKWRVMGVSDNGELELISEINAETRTDVIYLNGATGYNNGVYLLNDICKSQYSNIELGITARSLTIEDIEERYSAAGREARDNSTNGIGGIQYGGTKSYGSGYNTYPTLYEKEAKSGVSGSIREEGISKSNPYYRTSSELFVSESIATANGSLTAVQTDYALYDIQETNDYFYNKTFYNIIFGTDSGYWLASRCVDCDSAVVGFAMQRVVENNIGGWDLFKSNKVVENSGNCLRPVVSLGANVIVTINNEQNSDTNMWALNPI